MKKIHFNLKFILSMMCVILLIMGMQLGLMQKSLIQAEASEKGGVKKGLELYEKGEYDAAQKQFNKYAKKASEAAVTNMSDKMKKAYLNTVLKYQTFSKFSKNNYKGEYIWGYFLTDINKDGKVELLVQHGASEANCLITIYKYSKGKAVKVKNVSGAHSVLYAYPDGNGFLIQAAHMGYEEIYLVNLNNNKVTKKQIGARDVGSGRYTDLPYILDGHLTDDQMNVDYSDLK